MKKIYKICLLAVVIAIFLSMGVCASAVGETTQATETDPTQAEIVNPPVYAAFPDEDQSITNGCRTVDGLIPLLGSSKRLETAAAAMLYEINSDTVVYAYNADASMYPASLVKVMTTLIAIEKGDLSETVTVTQSAMDAAPESAVTVNLKVGEMLTLEQLLYCIMVGGGNDACTMVAEHISGSQAAFVAEMNRKAVELGCTGTTFTNCHGVHDNAQVTTARDMCKILRAAVKNEEFKEIFSTTVYRVGETNKSDLRRMEVSNLLMAESSKSYYDAHVTGGRTGITEDERRNLVSTAEDEKLSYIVVILGAVPKYASSGKVTYYGSYEETKMLVDLGFDGLEIRQTLYDGQIYTQFPVENGSSQVAVGPNQTQYIVLPKNVKFNQLTVKYNTAISNANAPIAKGQVISDVQLWYGNVCLAQSEMVSKHSVAVRTQRQTVEPSNPGISFSGFFQVVGIIALIALGAFLILYLIRMVHTAKRRAKIRRRRRDRRRSR